jgi:hypothetical protein
MHETSARLNAATSQERADSEQTSLVFHVHDESMFQRLLMPN